MLPDNRSGSFSIGKEWAYYGRKNVKIVESYYSEVLFLVLQAIMEQ
jgi:hypothetical protein